MFILTAPHAPMPTHPTDSHVMHCQQWKSQLQLRPKYEHMYVYKYEHMYVYKYEQIAAVAQV